MTEILSCKRTLYILFALLSFMPLQLAAQQVSIEGVVMDEKGDPLQGANIIIANSAMGTVSDPFGRFTLQVCRQVRTV
ncbi:MAG: carboxypeptidase-like regulatory domain-containing protein [Cyclonatronaceae bacterium]